MALVEQRDRRGAGWPGRPAAAGRARLWTTVFGTFMFAPLGVAPDGAAPVFGRVGGADDLQRRLRAQRAR